MHHTAFIHLSFLSRKKCLKGGKNDNFFFGRTEINLKHTEKGEKKIWKNVTLKYDAISDGVWREASVKKRMYFTFWEHVKVIKVTGKRHC